MSAARVSDLEEARSLHRRGRLDDAARAYAALAAGAPADPDLIGLMGILAQQRGDGARAAALLDRALALAAPTGVALRNLNARAILVREGEGDAALAALLTRFRPAAPVAVPVDAAEVGACASLASLALLAGQTDLAGDLADALLGAAGQGIGAAQGGHLGAIVAALGREPALEALAARMGADARLMLIRAGAAAADAGREKTAAAARRLLCRDHPLYRDPRLGAETGALRVLVLTAPPAVTPKTEREVYRRGNTIAAFMEGYEGHDLAFDSYLIDGAPADAAAPDATPPDATAPGATAHDAMPCGGGSAAPRHLPTDIDLVFNNLANGEFGVVTGADARAMAVAARLGVAMLNPPHLVRHTTREGTARRLAGIEGLVAPRTVLYRSAGGDAAALADSIALEVGLPVILRSLTGHVGRDMHLCRSAGDLRNTLEGFAGRFVYAIAYRENRVAPGLWRKFRAAVIDGALYPHKLMYGEDWMVHGQDWRRLAPVRPDLAAEEERYLDDMAGYLGPTAMAALEEIAARLPLDFLGIDFALERDGRLVVFEANAAMRVLPVAGRMQMPYLDRSRARIRRAFEAMLLRRAREGRAARRRAAP